MSSTHAKSELLGRIDRELKGRTAQDRLRDLVEHPGQIIPLDEARGMIDAGAPVSCLFEEVLRTDHAALADGDLMRWMPSSRQLLREALLELPQSKRPMVNGIVPTITMRNPATGTTVCVRIVEPDERTLPAMRAALALARAEARAETKYRDHETLLRFAAEKECHQS